MKTLLAYSRLNRIHLRRRLRKLAKHTKVHDTPVPTYTADAAHKDDHTHWEKAPTHATHTRATHTDPPPHDASMEKDRRLTSARFEQKVPQAEPLPPAYDECVGFAPPPHPPPEKKHLESRGRPREILYKSQLNELVRRKQIRRPSPPRQRVALKDRTDYGAILRLQAASKAWEGHFGTVRTALAAALVLSVILHVLHTDTGIY